MNRELKFRAWSYKHKKMYFSNISSWFEINDTGWSYFTREVEFQQPLELFYDVNGDIQQFTGAKDKNNKDIYEGDIIKYKEQIGFIEFFAGMFISSWKDQTDNELSYMIINHIDVIGNIFENSYLLEGYTSETQKKCWDGMVKQQIEDNNKSDIEFLKKCEECGEAAWDGYICHSCGMKNI